MIFNHKNLQVFIYRDPVDMRKGHDGLSSIVENQMKQELLSGAVFLFVNKNRRLCKALYFDGTGVVIVHKRLESGRFMSFLGFKENQKISLSVLAMVMNGDEIKIQKRAKQFSYGNKRPKPTNRRVRLKTNHEYFNQVIGVLNGSVKMLIDENKRLKEALGDDKQNALIELQDQVEMLNRRFFDKGSETLNKSRPPTNYDRELLPHNVPPVEIPKENLPKINEVEINHIEVTCPCCNDPKLEEMKGQFEQSEEIDLVEKTAIKKRHKRQKYRCKNCESIVTANRSAKVKKGSKYSINFCVSTAIDKFSYHLPLERQARRFEEQGLKIDTKTLFNGTQALYLNLESIAEMIKKEILSYGYVHVDETRGKLLSTNTNGYIWSMGNKYGAYFQYETTRSGQVAEEMLGNFKGVIINDGFTGYNRFKRDKKLKVAHCWSHARRKFFDYLDNYPKAQKIIELMDELFSIERQSKGSFKRLKNLRKTKSKKIVEDLYERLLKLERQSLPRSGIGKAVSYTLNLWSGLTYFLSDAKIPLSNNLAERVLRNPVKGRDNYNGYRTINGADVAMFYYTIIETCKLLGINARAYLIEQSHRHWEGLELQTPLQWAAGGPTERGPAQA